MGSRQEQRITPHNKKRSSFHHILEAVLESESFSASATRTLLGLLVFGGVLVIGAMAPNIFSSFDHFHKGKSLSRKFDKRKVQYSVAYLRKKKLITCIKKEKNATLVQITKDGTKRLRRFIMDELTIGKPPKWDGKWHVIIFDIPEYFKVARNALRRKLQELGFRQLQRSVFIYPYPAEDEVLFIASLFDVERYIEILTVEKMLHDKELRSFFNLR